jgi:hypothetical protein
MLNASTMLLLICVFVECFCLGGQVTLLLLGSQRDKHEKRETENDDSVEKK